jgi:hypothetical protein
MNSKICALGLLLFIFCSTPLAASDENQRSIIPEREYAAVSLDDRLEELQDGLIRALGQGIRYSGKGAFAVGIWISQVMVHASS